MIRLASSAPPLWRSPTSLQLGADARVRIDDVRPWQERLLGALSLGVPDGMLTTLAIDAGATASDAEAFVEQIRAALEPPRHRIGRVRLEVDDAVSPHDRRIVDAAIDSAGLAASDDDATAPRLLVVARLMSPQRSAALLAGDVVHVPVQLAGDRVDVGPRIVPGTTACAACIHAERAADDPSWPVVAAQLLARRPEPTEPALVIEAVAAALRLLNDPVSEQSASVTLRAHDQSPTWHDHSPHPDCWCRSPGRSETPAVRVGPTSEPTSATVFARPA